MPLETKVPNLTFDEIEVGATAVTALVARAKRTAGFVTK